MRHDSSTQLVGRRRIVRIVAALVVVGMVVYSYAQRQRAGRQLAEPAPATTDSAPESDEAPKTPVDEAPAAESPHTRETAKKPNLVANQTIRDLEGEVVYRGDVDLTETLARIEAGRRLRYTNDGSVFQNRERRLPRQPPGYYREYVHPTDELDGPGPQRIVTGEGGEIYYTPDHYRTFRRIDAR